MLASQYTADLCQRFPFTSLFECRIMLRYEKESKKEFCLSGISCNTTSRSKWKKKNPEMYVQCQAARRSCRL